MTFTTHGHHIKGTILSVTARPNIARCGGPGLCDICSTEAYMLTSAQGIPSAHTFEFIKKETFTMENANKNTVNPKKYLRKPFEVEAIQVTDQNFDAVAAWCGGKIVTVQETQAELPEFDTVPQRRYISVEVARPLSRRQTEAYVGDWILYASKGYKVYANRPFMKNFEEKGEAVEELFVTAEAVRAADAVSESWPA